VDQPVSYSECVAFRVGVDLVDVDGVVSSLDKFGARYSERVYTPWELADCEGPLPSKAQSLAARFAAKEAVLKALRVSDRVPPWTDIEVRRTDGGWCELRLYGLAASLADRAGLDEWSLSLTHEAKMAVAVVVASGNQVPAALPAPESADTGIKTMATGLIEERVREGGVVEATIRRILSSQVKMDTDPQTVGADVDLYALGMTSHAAVDVMLGLEDEFSFEFPDRLLTRSTFQTVNNIKEALADAGVAVS
jgi:holo-[acyl-carrier protein] synthase